MQVPTPVKKLTALGGNLLKAFRRYTEVETNRHDVVKLLNHPSQITLSLTINVNQIIENGTSLLLYF